MSMPISFMTAIASGRTELGLVPALNTSKPPPPSVRNNPSPIWLRAELPVHRTRILFVISMSSPFCWFRLPRRRASHRRQDVGRRREICQVLVLYSWFNPPEPRTQSSFLRATRVDSCKHAAVPFPIDPKCDIDQRNQNRDLDQRSDHGCESGTVVDAERGDCHGDGEFEIVRRCGEGKRGCFRIVGTHLLTHPKRHEEHDDEVDSQRDGNSNHVEW